jgi:hypothetical protein
MSALGEALGRILGRRRPSGGPDRPDQELAYVLYWTKTARGWQGGRRAQVRSAVRAVVNEDGFTANALERRYRVPGLDDSGHAGASLMALLKVLEGLDRFELEHKEETR